MIGKTPADRLLEYIGSKYPEIFNEAINSNVIGPHIWFTGSQIWKIANDIPFDKNDKSIDLDIFCTTNTAETNLVC